MAIKCACKLVTLLRFTFHVYMKGRTDGRTDGPTYVSTYVRTVDDVMAIKPNYDGLPVNLSYGALRARSSANIFLIWWINGRCTFLQVAQAYSEKENPKFTSKQQSSV